MDLSTLCRAASLASVIEGALVALVEVESVS
jgi:hypothetical protein